MVDVNAFEAAGRRVEAADVFVAIGTSGVVWPAAGFIELAARSGARMIEINPEASEASVAFGTRLRQPAAEAVPALFPLPVD